MNHRVIKCYKALALETPFLAPLYIIIHGYFCVYSSIVFKSIKMVISLIYGT